MKLLEKMAEGSVITLWICCSIKLSVKMKNMFFSFYLKTEKKKKTFLANTINFSIALSITNHRSHLQKVYKESRDKNHKILWMSMEFRA